MPRMRFGPESQSRRIIPRLGRFAATCHEDLTINFFAMRKSLNVRNILHVEGDADGKNTNFRL